MILSSIDFTKFYDRVLDIFSTYFSRNEIDILMSHMVVLSVSNFECYKANMTVIEARKKDKNNHKIVSDMEWVARNVGEKRVFSKAEINKFISKTKSTKKVVKSEQWYSDDVVYSIGEMLDRLSIEFIKREDFTKNNRSNEKTKLSQELTDRVEKYLKAKLNEIDEKKFYECVHEQRTYDLEGITKESPAIWIKEKF